MKPSTARSLAILCPMAFLCACAGSSGGGKEPAILSTPFGQSLRALWKASGGLETWRRFGEVRYTYEADGVGRSLGPAEIRYETRSWSPLEVRRDGERRDLSLEGPPGPDLADYAYRSIRIFFAFPFVLAGPGWEFRRHIVSGEEMDPQEMLVEPKDVPSPHQEYLVMLDPATGLPRAVYYKVQHPCLQGMILQATFGRYREIQGLRLPTEIVHRVCGPPGTAGRYPWEAAASPPVQREEEFFLRERIEKVEFLVRQEPAPSAGPSGEGVPR